MIKVALLYGGSSTEREISFKTADEMHKHLDKAKYAVEKIDLPDTHSNSWVIKLIQSNPDIVLSALHGGDGEDGTVQGLLECLNIPYVGTKVLGSAICMDKYLSKQIMKLNHIPVADDLLIERNECYKNFQSEIEKIGYPLVVKPNKGGSSVGISIVNSWDELPNAIELVNSLNDDILVEKYIQGREVTCGILQSKSGVDVLNVLDITANTAFYDYRAKYEDDSTQIVFSTLPQFLQEMIQEIAKKVFTVLKCTGYGRVDMIVHQEQIVVLEMNTLPGMTSHSLIPKAIQSKGMSYGDFLNNLIEFELEDFTFKRS